MASQPENSAPPRDDLRREAANWLRLQELYHLLESTPPAQQAEVLEQATSDPLLRTRVLSLLATASEPELTVPDLETSVAPGARIGPFAVIRLLGTGGLGSVYLVERILGGAVQRCALKLLASRPADQSFRARFGREQQMLATLQHPHITHLVDAGITEFGQP